MYTQQYCTDNLFTIRQGDAYPIYFEFYNDEGEVITSSSCMSIFISIDKRGKSAVWNTELSKWTYQLTQNDSYSMKPGIVPVSVLVKFSATNIVNIDMDPMKVEPTLNKVIL